MRRWSAVLSGLLLLLVCTGVLEGCSDEPGSKAVRDNPKATLLQAKKRLDRTSSVHFRVTSAGLPETGAVLVSGDGVAKRPASFSGRFRLASGGAALTLRVVSLDGTLYAEVPFTDRYAATDPDSLGVPDPALLLDPKQGLSSFLSSATKVTRAGKSRSGREVLERLDARLPAKAVDKILFVADPTAMIHVSFFVVDGSRQLRKATFRGAFYAKKTTTTYTVVLDRYGAPATISKPR